MKGEEECNETLQTTIQPSKVPAPGRDVDLQGLSPKAPLLAQFDSSQGVMILRFFLGALFSEDSMALSGSYVQPINRIPEIFNKIRDGQAPDQFTNQILKDWGFTSTNDRAFIPLLKSLGFLSSDGKPTQRYNDYRDHSRSTLIMADALRDAYGDLFLIKEHPGQADKQTIEGKFKSFHNVSENVAGLMTKTFLGLLSLADLSKKQPASTSPKGPEKNVPVDTPQLDKKLGQGASGLHYNIQIHLPATKDVEVYNSIFKSLKEHLFEK